MRILTWPLSTTANKSSAIACVASRVMPERNQVLRSRLVHFSRVRLNQRNQAWVEIDESAEELASFGKSGRQSRPKWLITKGFSQTAKKKRILRPGCPLVSVDLVEKDGTKALSLHTKRPQVPRR